MSSSSNLGFAFLLITIMFALALFTAFYSDYCYSQTLNENINTVNNNSADITNIGNSTNPNLSNPTSVLQYISYITPFNNQCGSEIWFLKIPMYLAFALLLWYLFPFKLGGA